MYLMRLSESWSFKNFHSSRERHTKQGQVKKINSDVTADSVQHQQENRFPILGVGPKNFAISGMITVSFVYVESRTELR